jgi:hypothetical protein
MSCTRLAAIAFASAAFATGALAQGGPVATDCASDIAKLCSGKPHDGSVRICLETNYGKVSAACKTALDSTGGGRGKQLNRGKGK